MKKLITILSIILMSFATFGQTYDMSNTPITTCSGTYYDPQGTSDYTNYEDFEQTFTPNTAGSMLQFIFTTFDTESITYDWLEIYDGPSTASSLIGKWGGSMAVGVGKVVTNPPG